MIPSVVPQDIVELHRALLSALRVEYFPPGMVEMNSWRDFLFVMKSLEDSASGPFKEADLAAVVNLMRAQNRDGAKWSLRFSKILRDPEAIRDLVLETRRKIRPRPPVVESSRTVGDVTIATEIDPAIDAAPLDIRGSVTEQLREFRKQMKGPAKK